MKDKMFVYRPGMRMERIYGLAEDISLIYMIINCICWFPDFHFLNGLNPSNSLNHSPFSLKLHIFAAPI